MPAHVSAAGVGVGLLATIAVGALIAKEVAENWDEITDKYDAFADKMEDDHELHLPRFRDRSEPFTHRRNTQGRYARQRQPDRDTSPAFGHSTTHADSNNVARNRFRDETPVNQAQQMFTEKEELDFQAAIEASLLVASSSASTVDYGAPDDPKLNVSQTDLLGDEVPPSLNAYHDAHESTEFQDHEESWESDIWSETWTMTDGSVQSETEHLAHDV